MGNLVFVDANGNGIKDAGENGLPGVTVNLYAAGTSTLVATTTTDVNGNYLFHNLNAGDYFIGVVVPTGYSIGANGVANPNNNVDNDNNGITFTNGEVRTGTITLAAGTEPSNDGDDSNGNLTLDVALKAVANNACPNSVFSEGFENGSFSSGSGSDLYNGLPRNGSYQVVQNVGQLGGGGYLNIQPKTGSYFLAAHTSNNENDRIYFTTVAVTPGQTYNFCAAVTLLKNLGGGANFILGLYVNGQQIGTGRVTFDWTQICGTYTAMPGETSIVLSIRDPKKGLFFVAIDDICVTPIAVTSNLRLGNQVWNDFDGDGKRDSNEPGIAGAEISLYTDNDANNLPDGAAIRTTMSDANGNYLFTGLAEGRYIASMPILPGYQQSPNTTTGGIVGALQPGCCSLDPDANINDDNNLVRLVGPNGLGGILYTNAITLTAGQEPTTDGDDANGNLTFDLAQCGTLGIGDFVWNDLNGNGIQDAGEPGINGVLVRITFSDGRFNEELTNTYLGKDGYYDFINLGPGTYVISFPTPAGFTPSPSNVGTDDTKDSDPVNGSVTVTLAPNQSDFTIDAGFVPKPTTNDCPITTTGSGYYGGFEAGANNITPTTGGSDLYNGLPRNGSYQIVQNVGQLGGGGYLNITPRSGSFFLAAHTSNNENDRIWYTTKTVVPGQTYSFCAAVTLLKNLGGGANFIVGIYANGVEIGRGRVTFDWTNICGTYTVPAGVTTVVFSIRDPKKGLFFLAIDDICINPSGSLTLGNYVWNDNNGNGKKDIHEYGLGGVPVSLYRDDNSDNLPDNPTPIAVTETNQQGYYKFTRLSNGRYITSIPILPGFIIPGNNDPNPDNNEDNDNNAIRVAGPNGPGGVVFTNAITLIAGTEPEDGGNTNNTLDMAMCALLWVGNFVWDDANRNGLQDAGEAGLNGVKITVIYPDGVTTESKTTYRWSDAQNPNISHDGYYDFPRVGPGTYTLKFAIPDAYMATLPNVGSNDAKDSDIDAGGNGTAILTFNLNDQAGSSNLHTDAGFHPIAPRSTNRQSNNDEFTLCDLKVALEPTHPLCSGHVTGRIKSTITGNTGSLSYTWSNGATGAHLSNVGAGTYTLTVIDNGTGCEIISEPMMLNNPGKMEVTLTSPEVNGYNVPCKNSNTGSIDLKVTGGKGTYSYSWNNGSSDVHLTNLAAGKYTVVVKDEAQCPVQASITLKQPANSMSIDAIVKAVDCTNPAGSIDLKTAGGVAPFTYSWSNASTAKKLDNVAAGSYTVTVKDAVGCELTKVIEVKNNSLLLELTTDKNTIIAGAGSASAILNAAVNGGNGNYTYTWNSNETLKVIGKEKASVTPIVTTNYSVSVKDDAGCAATANVTVQVVTAAVVAKEPAVPSIGVEIMKVTPNPSNGVFNVMLKGFTAGKVEVRVLDVNGKEVSTMQLNVVGEQQAVPFNLNKLSRGMYFVNVVSATGSYQEKVIIK